MDGARFEKLEQTKQKHSSSDKYRGGACLTSGIAICYQHQKNHCRDSKEHSAMVKFFRRLNTVVTLLTFCFLANTFLFAYFVAHHSNQKPGGLVVVTNTPQSTPKQRCSNTVSTDNQPKNIMTGMQ